MLQIITDSACDLPESSRLITISTYPFIVHINDEEYVDGETIEPEAVYQAIREGKRTSTSQVPAEFF